MKVYVLNLIGLAKLKRLKGCNFLSDEEMNRFEENIFKREK